MRIPSAEPRDTFETVHATNLDVLLNMPLRTLLRFDSICGVLMDVNQTEEFVESPDVNPEDELDAALANIEACILEAQRKGWAPSQA